jgi:hypothetical protein
MALCITAWRIDLGMDTVQRLNYLGLLPEAHGVRSCLRECHCGLGLLSYVAG